MPRKSASAAPTPVPYPTILSRRGYAILKPPPEEETPEDRAFFEALRARMTVSPKSNPAMQGPSAPTIEFPVYRENRTRIYLPRSYGLRVYGPPDEDRLSLPDPPPAARMAFRGTLRPNQEAPVAAFLAAARDPSRRGGLLILPCAYGKTSMSLYIATQLRQKTLVVCHKGFLLDQWRERIAQFVPTAQVGLIQQKRVDVAGRDIVLASLQSLSMRDYPEELFHGFGFVVFDEVHHTSAEVFSRALAKLTAPYMLGLSATPNRKDGLRKVFEWFLGRPAFEVRQRQDTSLWIQMVQYEDPHPDYATEQRLWTGKPNTARMINQVTGFGPRNDRILAEIRRVHERDPDRRWLILSERRAHLVDLAARIAAAGLGTTGLYVGGMKAEALAESARQKFVLATNQVASEGFDVPALNTLVLASPISSVEQPVGRVQRQKPEERTHVPLVIDIWDQISMFRQQGIRRIQFYKKAGYAFLGPDGRPRDGDAAAATDADDPDAPALAPVPAFIEDSDDAEQ